MKKECKYSPDGQHKFIAKFPEEKLPVVIMEEVNLTPSKPSTYKQCKYCGLIKY